MPEEPSFIYDREREKAEQQLRYITKLVSEKPKAYSPESVFLKKFLIALYRSGKIHRQLDLSPRKQVIAKKPEIKIVLKPIQKPVEAPKSIEEVPKPVMEAPKPVVEMPAQPQFPEYPLIISKDTQQVLVKAEIKDNNYVLEEPQLSDNDVKVILTVNKNIGNKLTKKPSLLEDKKYLMSNISNTAKKFGIQLVDDAYFEKIRYYLTRDIIGFGKIDSLLKDTSIKEIYCDGSNKPVNVLYKDKQIQANIMLNSDSEVDAFINKIILMSKQKIKEDQPFIDINADGINLKATRGLGVTSSKFVIKRI